MSSKTIVVKNPFMDREHEGKKRKAGETLRVSPDRAKRLIELGYAVASTEEEAQEIKEAEPKTIAVFKYESQWVEEPKKATKKK